MKIKKLDGTVELENISKGKSTKIKSVDIEEDISVEEVEIKREFIDIKPKKLDNAKDSFLIDFKDMLGDVYSQNGSYFEEK